MKKTILFFFLLMMGSAGFSQGKPGRQAATPEYRAQKVTEQINQLVQLSPEQFVQVKSICLERAKKVDNNRSVNTKNKVEFEKQKKIIHANWDASMRKVLNKEQIVLFENYVKEQAEKKKTKGSAGN